MELALTVIFAFALGASVASFLNVVADRLPAGGSLRHPPSHCPVDGHVLAPVELVPVFSYLLLRGRCRVCGNRIPARVLVVELIGGAMFAAVGWHYGASLDALLLVTALSFLLVIAVIDLEHKLVLNTLMLAAFPVALISAPWWSDALREPVWGVGPPQLSLLIDSTIAGVVGFVALLLLALAVPRGTGFGDVKLMGVIGLWVGLRRLPVAYFIAAVLAGIVAIVLLLARWRNRKDTIPFAPFLCTGTAISLIWGDLIGDWYLELLTP